MIRLVEQQQDTRKAASSLAFLEMRSAIRRRERDGSLTADSAARAAASASAEARLLVLYPVTEAILSRSSGVVDRYPLRAMDAIHLATALQLQEETARQLTFVCSDERLLLAAGQAGLDTLNPAELAE